MMFNHGHTHFHARVVPRQGIPFISNSVAGFEQIRSAGGWGYGFKCRSMTELASAQRLLGIRPTPPASASLITGSPDLDPLHLRTDPFVTLLIASHRFSSVDPLHGGAESDARVGGIGCGHEWVPAA